MPKQVVSSRAGFRVAGGQIAQGGGDARSGAPDGYRADASATFKTAA